MEGRKAELLQRIESDREVLLAFFRCFIRCSSPNPPGDTREAADHIRQFLVRHGTDCRVIAPNEIMPNIVATFEAWKTRASSRAQRPYRLLPGGRWCRLDAWVAAGKQPAPRQQYAPAPALCPPDAQQLEQLR